jgi:hypothetical protein
MAAVQTLCRKGLLLDKGKIVVHGLVSEAVQSYLRQSGTVDRAYQRNLSSALQLLNVVFTPCVVESNRGLTARVDLAALADESISDLALLVHSANGERAALVDLRSPKGPYRLAGGERLSVTANIDSVPLVEADFNIGLYVNADSVCDSFMNILTLTVLPRCDDHGLVSRDAQFRGVVELVSHVEHSIDGDRGGG